MEKKNKLFLAGSLSLIAGGLAVTGANAENLFNYNPLGSGTEVRTNLTNAGFESSLDNLRLEAKCGGKSKTDSTKGKDQKCGGKKKDAKGKDHKCGEGKCGGDKKKGS